MKHLTRPPPESIGLSILVAVAVVMLAASPVSAQDPDRGSFVPAVIKRALLDPTTYAPAIVAWEATRLDWKSSQVFFQNGFVEHNPNFTLSGLGNDTAMGYGAGNRRIFTDALSNLQVSFANNVTSRVIERVLMPRYPGHRKLLRTIGWIERVGMASALSYHLSAGHLRQWQDNERRARALGYE